MSTPPDIAMVQAAHEQTATKLELDAAIMNFQGAVYRGEPARLSLTTEAAQAALQAHLDAISGLWALAKRSAGQ